jgi:hypothetical protein
MALNSSGTISLGGSTSGQSVALELGLSATGTLSMSQLYRGGAYVKPGISNGYNTGVPSSGAISFSNLYGMVRRVAYNINFAGSSFSQQTFTTNAPNGTISYEYAGGAGGGGSGYVAGITDVTIVIPSGTTIYSTSSASAAMTFSGFSSGDQVKIDNYGVIAGKGGDGGTATGGAGGDAINYNPANAAFYPYNYSGGVIAGGGGGGGRGAAVSVSVDVPSGYSVTTYTFHARGGGAGGGAGGNGFSNSSGSSYVGNASLTSYVSTTTSGGSGSSTAGGSAGNGDYGYYYTVSNYYLVRGGSGGAGGARGAAGGGGNQGFLDGPPGVSYIPNYPTVTPAYPGSNGYASTQSGYFYGSGGAAGNAIRGTSKHGQALQNSGTVLGPQVSS